MESMDVMSCTKVEKVWLYREEAWQTLYNLFPEYQELNSLRRCRKVNPTHITDALRMRKYIFRELRDICQVVWGGRGNTTLGNACVQLMLEMDVDVVEWLVTYCVTHSKLLQRISLAQLQKHTSTDKEFWNAVRKISDPRLRDTHQEVIIGHYSFSSSRDGNKLFFTALDKLFEEGGV